MSIWKVRITFCQTVLYCLRLPTKQLLWWPLCQYVYACISLTNNFYKTNTNTFRALRWFKKYIYIWTNKKSTFCEEIHHSAYPSWIIWLWNLHYINGSLFYGNSLSYFFLLNKYFTFCNFLKVADYIFFSRRHKHH